MSLLIEADPEFADTLAFALGEDVHRVDNPVAAGHAIDERPEELLVVVGPDVDLDQILELAAVWQVERPEIGVLLLRHRIDVAVMGRALRAGVREVISPDDLSAVVDAARRVADVGRRRRAVGRPDADGGRTHAHVTTVFSAKGGCGKTTVSTNLAVHLASQGHRVCLVDLDLEFGDVAITLQVAPERTVVDLIAMAGSIDEHGISSVVTEGPEGLHTILAPTSPGEAAPVSAAVVAETLRVLQRAYDHVVIDTPPAITEHVLAALDASDSTVLLATLDVPALKNLKVSLDTLDLLGYAKDSRILVLNRADARVGLEISDVETTIGGPVAVQIPSSGEVPAAINRGRLMVTEHPDHVVSRALMSLSSRISGTPLPEAATGRGGGLRTLLRRGGTR